MMRIDALLLGAVVYRFPLQESRAVFEILQSERFSPKGLKRVEKRKGITFYIPLLEKARFERCLTERALCPTRGVVVGIPSLWHRLLCRPGMLIGVLLALVLFFLARCFVWEIKISGNSDIGDIELERQLSSAGVKRGCFLGDLEPDHIEAALREGNERISYASIHLVGTVAHVQIRESEAPSQQETPLPANLVAAKDGVVILPLVFEGECVVAPGQVVRAGELLVSGISDTQNHGYRMQRAAGSVLARTAAQYSVTVPFSYESKRDLGRVGSELSLFFFGFAQKVYKNTGNISTTCDIIEKIEWLTLPSGKRLPIGYKSTVYRAYTYESASRTALQARKLAVQELEALLASDSGRRTLLQKTTQYRLDASGVTLLCDVVCEEDIALTVEITKAAEDIYGTGNHQNRS